MINSRFLEVWLATVLTVLGAIDRSIGSLGVESQERIYRTKLDSHIYVLMDMIYRSDSIGLNALFIPSLISIYIERRVQLKMRFGYSFLELHNGLLINA